MGRPPLPLNVVKVTVRLPIALNERIDRLVGTYRRAQFIRAAIEEKLKREEAQPREG